MALYQRSAFRYDKRFGDCASCADVFPTIDTTYPTTMTPEPSQAAMVAPIVPGTVIEALQPSTCPRSKWLLWLAVGLGVGYLAK